MKHTRESLEKMHELELLDAAKPLGLISLTELKPLREWADGCIAQVEKRSLVRDFNHELRPPPRHSALCNRELDLIIFDVIKAATDPRKVIIAAILCAQEEVAK